MRKWITFLMTFLVGSASYVNATMGDVNVFAGYRHDSVENKNRVPSSDPLLKQHLKFKDVDIFQIGVNVRSTIGCNFYARAEATWGWVLDGEIERKSSFRNEFSTYSSYGGFNTFEEIKHKNVLDEKYVYDANIAIGYPFYFCDCSAVVAPVIGYAVDTQNFNSHVGDFTFGRNSECGNYFGSNDCCCKHSYLHRWYGPFVGVDFNYRPYHDCWNLYAAFEYHWGRCKLKQTVDSDDEFTRFNRHSDMDGWVVDLGADYEMNDQWTVGLYLKFTDFNASKHHHSWGGDYYYSSRDSKGKHQTNWTSYAVNIELGKQF